MQGAEQSPGADVLLVWAYWLNAVLVLLAAPLSILYVLLMSQASEVPLQALAPLLFAGLAFVHMAVLSSLYRNPSEPIALWLHALAAVSGCIALIFLFGSTAGEPHGTLFFPFVAVGVVISIAVCRGLVARLRWRSGP